MSTTQCGGQWRTGRGVDGVEQHAVTVGDRAGTVLADEPVPHATRLHRQAASLVAVTVGRSRESEGDAKFGGAATPEQSQTPQQARADTAVDSGTDCYGGVLARISRRVAWRGSSCWLNRRNCCWRISMSEASEGVVVSGYPNAIASVWVLSRSRMRGPALCARIGQCESAGHAGSSTTHAGPAANGGAQARLITAALRREGWCARRGGAHHPGGATRCAGQGFGACVDVVTGERRKGVTPQEPPDE